MQIRTKAILLAAAAWVACSTAEAAVQHRTNREYGFSVDFPSGLQVSRNMSWTHPHGWGVTLSRGAAGPERSILVVGDYNSSFSKTPEAAADCGSRELAAGAKLGLAFPGRRSVVCREDHPDDEILVMVHALAGRQPDRSAADPDSLAPWIDYEAALTTTPRMLAKDLAVFRRVLASVRLHPGRD